MYAVCVLILYGLNENDELVTMTRCSKTSKRQHMYAVCVLILYGLNENDELVTLPRCPHALERASPDPHTAARSSGLSAPGPVSRPVSRPVSVDWHSKR